jgi:hypothetical protein
MSDKLYSEGYWLRIDSKESLGLTRWHLEAEQYVFAFVNRQPRALKWAASLTTADGEYYIGGYPL